MNSPKNILFLEDDPSYVQLTCERISEEWPDCRVDSVCSEQQYLTALEKGTHDLIISDYNVPNFSGMAALRITRKRCTDVPFLFLSGAIGDELAVESLKFGATDYIFKDRSARLIPAIRRALDIAVECKRRREIEEQLRRSEEQYR